MTDSKFFINISTYGILVIFSIFIRLINIIFLKHLHISKIISNFARKIVLQIISSLTDVKQKDIIKAQSVAIKYSVISPT